MKLEQWCLKPLWVVPQYLYSLLTKSQTAPPTSSATLKLAAASTILKKVATGQDMYFSVRGSELQNGLSVEYCIYI